MAFFSSLPEDVRDTIVVIVDEDAPRWGGGSRVYEYLAFVINNEYGDYIWAKTITGTGVHAVYMASRKRNFTAQAVRQIKEDFKKKYDSAISKSPEWKPSTGLNPPNPNLGAYSVAPSRAGVTLSSDFSPQGVTSSSLPQQRVVYPATLPPPPSRTMPPYSSPDSPYAHIPYTGPPAPSLGSSSSTFSTERVQQMFPLSPRARPSGRNQYSGLAPP